MLARVLHVGSENCFCLVIRGGWGLLVSRGELCAKGNEATHSNISREVESIMFFVPLFRRGSSGSHAHSPTVQAAYIVFLCETLGQGTGGSFISRHTSLISRMNARRKGRSNTCCARMPPAVPYECSISCHIDEG